MSDSRILAAALTLTLFTPATLRAQPAALFDEGLDDWSLLNGEADSFELLDGREPVLRVSGSRGWLRSPDIHGDFELSGQVRFVEPDSDSGIFLRVEPGTDFILGWPGDAYQVQMREISVNAGDNPLPLANLYRHRVADGPTDYRRERVFALYSGVGRWQDFTIRVSGDSLQVELNGERVTEAGGLENASGHIGFQSEKGIVEYRNMAISTTPVSE